MVLPKCGADFSWLLRIREIDEQWLLRMTFSSKKELRSKGAIAGRRYNADSGHRDGGSADDKYFETVVGHLETLVMGNGETHIILGLLKSQ